MSVTASLCGQGCKRVKKRFVFSVRETRPCCYPVSEHNAAKQPGSLSIPPFRAETELDLLWNSCAVFTSKATWTSNVLRFVFHWSSALTGVCLNHDGLRARFRKCREVGLDAPISPDACRNNTHCPASSPCSHWSDVAAFSTTGQGQSVLYWQSKRSLFNLYSHSEGTHVPTHH